MRQASFGISHVMQPPVPWVENGKERRVNWSEGGGGGLVRARRASANQISR